uniref:Uncharacterized protein n=1 Tax=Arundo donax TaxID=35708 RepID=A0A0A9CA36_ARUDO
MLPGATASAPLIIG